MSKLEDKPFAIPKPMVWEAWRRVKANTGAPGVDGQHLEEFEAGLADNLYKIRNRMSSGSYFPPPVRAVEIPKPHGSGVRTLGVPTIADRVAQTVVAMHLEERADHRFHPDPYGYRPGKSAHQAFAACRQRCWKNDWAIDFDVQKFFDEVPWDLVLRAVRAVTEARWAMLYVERWPAAPLERPGGALEQRSKGPRKGSAVSPILANLFMHYARDLWMARNFPGCPFERYADAAVVHCETRRQAEYVLSRIAAPMQGVGLRLHPGKTRIVHCKDGRRRAGARGKLSELLEPLRSRYVISREINSKAGDQGGKMEELVERYQDGQITRLDGVSVNYNDWHFNVRPSNTEPLLRLNVESLVSREHMEDKRREVLSPIRP